MDRPRFRAVFFHPRFWLLWLGLGLLWLIVQLPYRALLAIGRVLGAGMYRVAGDRRRIAARNLELCFPEKSAKERKHLLKENFASTGIAFFEMAMSWWWSKPRLARLAHVDGLEHLKQAQLEGKGVILMALHFTTLEIGAALLGQKHTIDGMYREHGNPLFDFVQRRGRERLRALKPHPLRARPRFPSLRLVYDSTFRPRWRMQWPIPSSTTRVRSFRWAWFEY